MQRFVVFVLLLWCQASLDTVFVVLNPTSVDPSAPVGSLSNPATSVSQGIALVSSGGSLILDNGYFLSDKDCSLVVSKSFSIIGSGQFLTFISCATFFAHLSHASWSFANLTITGGQTKSSMLVQNGTLSLSSVTFSGNTGAPTAADFWVGGGAALSMDSGELSASHCLFADNAFTSTHGQSSAFGGAVLLGDVNATFEDCTFRGNRVQSSNSLGGAIALNSTNSPFGYFKNCIFEDNSATGSDPVAESEALGGAMYFVSGHVSISDTHFSANSASVPNGQCAGGTIFAFSEPANQALRFEITGCTFVNNILPNGGEGSALLFTDGALTVTDTLFLNNRIVSPASAVASAGGAVAILYALSSSFYSCNFTNNSVTNYAEQGFAQGGSLGCESTPLTIERCTFTGNYVSNLGAGGYAQGGAIFAQGDRASIVATTLLSSSAVSNSNQQSSEGGGVYLKSAPSFTILDCHISDSVSSGSGGGIILDSSTGSISSSSFTRNSAGGANQKGGGGVSLTGLGEVLFDSCVFTSNKAASFFGGAVSVADLFTAVYSDCDFDANKATEGGALAMAGEQITLQNCVFSNNAAQRGGAISTLIGEQVIAGCRFVNNSAVAANQDFGGNGGAVYLGTGTVNVTSSVFIGNLANPKGRTQEGELIVGGGAIYSSATMLSVVSCNFTANIVLSCFDVITSESCLLGSNTCRCGGGAVVIQSPQAPIVDSVFTNNQVPALMAGTGGALLTTNGQGQVVLLGCVLSDNSAGESGGAWFVDGGGTVQHSLFRDNESFDGNAIQVHSSVLRVVADVSLCGTGMQVQCSEDAGEVLGNFNESPTAETSNCHFYHQEQINYPSDAVQLFICGNSTIPLVLTLEDNIVGIHLYAYTRGVLLTLLIEGSSTPLPPKPEYALSYPTFSQGATIYINVSSDHDTLASLALVKTVCDVSLHNSVLTIGGVRYPNTTSYGAWRWTAFTIVIYIRNDFNEEYNNQTCSQSLPISLVSSIPLDNFPMIIHPSSCGAEGCTVHVSPDTVGQFDIGLLVPGEYVQKLNIHVRSWLLSLVLPLVVAAILITILVIQVRKILRNRVEKEAEFLLSGYSYHKTGGGPAVSLRDFSAVSGYQSLLIPPEDIKFLRQVSSGASGIVLLSLWHKAQVAVKKHHTSSLQKTEFMNEALLHRTLHHPNIVQLFGICEDPPMTVMEWMHRGSLYHILHSPSSHLPWDRKVSLALDAARGMLYLHDSGIVHRDLKTLNLLVDEHWVCKVSDFGLSRTSTAHVTASTGTMLWSAPETWTSGGTYSFQADVYSFGIILWEILTCEEPFAGEQSPGLLMEIVREGKRPTVPADCPPEYAKLMTSCWQANPEERPNFLQVVEVLETELRSLRGEEATEVDI